MSSNDVLYHSNPEVRKAIDICVAVMRKHHSVNGADPTQAILKLAAGGTCRSIGRSPKDRRAIFESAWRHLVARKVLARDEKTGSMVAGPKMPASCPVVQPRAKTGVSPVVFLAPSY